MNLKLLGIIIWPPGLEQDSYNVTLVYPNTLFLVDLEFSMYRVPLSQVTSNSMEIGSVIPVDFLKLIDPQLYMPEDFFNENRKNMRAVYNLCKRFSISPDNSQHNICFIFIDIIHSVKDYIFCNDTIFFY